MPTVRLVVPGEPVVKQRPRFNAATRTTYTPSMTTKVENAIAWLWRDRKRQPVPPKTPFGVKITALFAHSQSHRNAKGDVKERHMDSLPGPRKDVDNIAKLVLDALNGVAWPDDRYCTALMIVKDWAPDHQRDGELQIEVYWCDPEPT